MQPSADGQGPGALLAQACAAYAQGRREEAAALASRLGPEAQGLAIYWPLAAAIAMDRGDLEGACAAQRRACDLHREQVGWESPRLLLDLLALCVAAGQADAALAARARAEAVLRPQLRPGQAVFAEEWAELWRQEGKLAALLWQEGRHDEAIAAQQRRLAALPEDPDALRRLRTALAERDRMAEALVVQLRISLQAPEVPTSARNLGHVLRRAGAAAAARAWFRRTLALSPQDAVALAGVEEPDPPAGAPPPDPLVARLARPLEGLAGAPMDPVWPLATARALVAAAATPPRGAAAAGWPALAREAAVAALRRVLALRPDHAEAAEQLAVLLLERDDPAPGLEALRGALKLAPGRAELHGRLGFQLRRFGRIAEAQQSFRTALALDPDSAQIMVGLADALAAAGPSPQAVALLDRARALDPAMPALQALTLRGLALMSLQRLEEAEAAFREGLALAPDDPHCNFDLGLTLLAMGRLEEGWPHYAWRWRSGEERGGRREPADPLRRPDPGQWAGRTVLLYAEQAQGDTIQFLRYARMVAACGARVLLEVPASLKTLAAGIADMAGVYAKGEPIPAWDEAVPLLHLPWAFGTTLATIPATVPYLRGDLALAAQFRRRMMGLPGLKVGLVWSGDPRPHIHHQAAMDRRRSVALADLAPLARVPGVVFVSLQKGAPAAQAASPPDGMVLHDWTGELEDFSATAALMSALDLVISVDTAPAHLAGAVGREVWLLNRFDTDFRWLTGRDDSPWYPTLRQFRQERPGDWDAVIGRVAAALAERVRRT